MRGFGARVYAVHPIQLCSALQSVAISVNGPWPRLINNYYQRPCLDSRTQSEVAVEVRLQRHEPWSMETTQEKSAGFENEKKFMKAD